MKFQALFNHIPDTARRTVTRGRQAIRERYPVFYRRFPDFWELARMHRPIGIYLLLWPTLWCLFIAAQGFPDWHLLVIFILGTVSMRAAGCAINDYADRDFDGHVARTKERPIVTNRVTPREALKLCAGLCVFSFLLVLMTNRLTVLMSFAGVALATLYPFMKRHTHLAQVFLGAAFSWGGMMAFTAQTGSLPVHAWLLYVANVLWTVVYDTEYAMVDREYDLKIGVKSTAILFEDMDRIAIGVLQVLFLLAMSLSAQHFGLGWLFQTGLVVAAGLFIYHQWLIRERRPEDCFRAFLHNHFVGLAVFIFTALDVLLLT